MKEIKELRKELDSGSVKVNGNLHEDLTTLFSKHLKDQNVPQFMELFWKEQQKYISTAKKGIR